MPWSELDWSAVGAGALFLILLLFQSVRGFISGKVAGAPAPLQMAGAVVDAARMDNLTDQVGLNTQAVIKLAGSIDKNTAAVEAHGSYVEAHRRLVEVNARHAASVAENADKLAREMRDLRDETKDLRDEMLRRGGRN